MSFGQIIKKLRREADMTQERLAELLSVSAQAVSRWENDSAMPDVSLLAPLANLFHVTTDYLLTGKPQGHTEEYIAGQAVMRQTDAMESLLQLRSRRPFSRQELAVLFAAMLMEP